MPRRFQAPYPAEFRDQAVNLVRTTGRPIPEIAGELGVNEQTLRNWVFAAEGQAAPAGPVNADERAELAQLRRRVKVLEAEREILKKAAAWFAKETGSTP